MPRSRFELTNKKVLVTGATGGIGKAIARMIIELGGYCILVGRNHELLSEMRLRWEAQVSAHVCNLLDEIQISSLVNDIPSLDGIVHAAGVVKPLPIKFLSDLRVDETLNLNFKVPVALTRMLLKKKKMNSCASQVFISSISADHPHKGGAAYAASKAALQAFSKTLALETAHLQMRSNCISPAMIKTAMYDIAEQGMTKEKLEEHIDSYPLGIGCPNDVAGATAFLLSDAARWITGINITLDGGFLLGK